MNKVHLTRLDKEKAIVEEKVVEFTILGGDTYMSPNNKKSMKPLKTSLGDYLNINTKEGDYSRWYITETLDKTQIKEVEEIIAESVG